MENLDEIVRSIQIERDKLDAAIQLLTHNTVRRYKKRRGKLSVAARNRISKAMRKRWKTKKKDAAGKPATT